MPMHRDLRHAALLTAANLLTMALPLIALPILARRVGVEMFGVIALAQSAGLVAVLLVDAGFNAESMRVTGSSGARAPLQPLVDNVIARSLVAIPAAGLVIAGGAFLPVPLPYVVVSLLQVVGTLLFPQWWLIANGESAALLILQLVGRVAAVLGILLWVHGPGDALLATALQSGATALSGLMFVAIRLLPRMGDLRTLDPRGHRTYLARVAPTIGPGFAAAMSGYLPQLVLGVSSGTQQVGVFAAAEKIVRAVAFAIGAMDQAFLAPVARRIGGDAGDGGTGRRIANRIVVGVFALGACAGLVLVLMAEPLIGRLFGSGFAQSAAVLAGLCVWLPSFVSRRAFVNLRLSADGRIRDVGRSQTVEAIATSVCVTVGAFTADALGAMAGLVVAEVLCWSALVVLQRRWRRVS